MIIHNNFIKSRFIRKVSIMKIFLARAPINAHITGTLQHQPGVPVTATENTLGYFTYLRGHSNITKRSFLHSSQVHLVCTLTQPAVPYCWSSSVCYNDSIFVIFKNNGGTGLSRLNHSSLLPYVVTYHNHCWDQIVLQMLAVNFLMLKEQFKPSGLYWCFLTN